MSYPTRAEGLGKYDKYDKACVLKSLLYASEMWTLYKHQLRTLERFRKRYLQQKVCIGLQSHIPDTELLERVGLPRTESMVVKGRHWAGNFVRMDHSRHPKQLFYSEICEGKRKAWKPKKRFKDSVKFSLIQISMSEDLWEKWHWIEISGANWFMWV